jgi:hypothetical protein
VSSETGCKNCPLARRNKLTEEAKREYLISILRWRSAEMLLAKNQLDTVGVALRNGIIDPDNAIPWLVELGAWDVAEHMAERRHD